MFAFDYIPLRFQIKFKKKKKKLTLNMPQPTSSSPLLASFEVPLSYAYISLALNVTSNIVVYQSKSFYFLSDFFFFYHTNKQSSVEILDSRVRLNGCMHCASCSVITVTCLSPRSTRLCEWGGLLPPVSLFCVLPKLQIHHAKTEQSADIWT